MPVLFAVSKHVNKSLLEKLRLDGKVSLLNENPYIPYPESCHADMQILSVSDDKIFVKEGICDSFLRDLEAAGKKAVVSGLKIYHEYPDCCSHNVLVCGKYYFHNFSATDTLIDKYLFDNHYFGINIKQGYSGCSACYVDPLDLLITGDRGLNKASSRYSFNSYLVPLHVIRNIELKGYKNGFIGGCMGYCKYNNTLYVNGSIKNIIPELYALLRQAGIRLVEADEDYLSDVGGIKCIVYK